MVIFSEWHRTAMDPKSRSGLPLTGEDTGLGALASPLAGYLGKVQERAGSLEYCPWCSSRGLTYTLRSYRINLQDSITLCTNPQCLFPLVSRSLEDVLASLDPVEPTVGNKRKNLLALEKEELTKPAHKRLRSSEPDSFGLQSVTETLISQAERGVVNVVSNGHHAAPKTDSEKVNGYHRDSSVAETGWDSPHSEDGVLDKEPDIPAPPSCSVSAGHLPCSSDALLTADGDDPAQSPHRGALGISDAKDDFRQVKSPFEALNTCCEENHSPEISSPSSQHNEQTGKTGQISLAVDINTCKDIKSETEDLSKSMETVPVPSQLFWKNSNNLCWLNSLLVALVNCKSLRKCKTKDEPQRPSVWRLMRGYEDICATVQAHQQPGRGGVMRVPKHVLKKANADLRSLRMSAFKLLQPKLHCKLGQRETPVFALPLLLTMDSWVEPLFQSTFHWEFKCSECKTATKERVVKTLPTFTNISPDWRPLHAVHSAPCNVCYKRNQTRTMMLERVPPVFQLHFVEGLPDSDVKIYTFTFRGKRYSVTTVIQYNQQLKHFVTWICNSDGSWLEYDDLKHPDCKTHEKLPVPAEEIHVVFWEVEEDKEPPACSPSSTFAESPPSKREMNPSSDDKDLTADEELSAARTLDNSPLMSHDDTDIVHALSPSEDNSNIMDTTVTAGVDTSIGSTTLLETFEGLTHNDIITLTLVELKVDSETQPVNDEGQTQVLSVPNRNEIPDSIPDSSSAVIDGEMSPSHHDELPTTSSSSESDHNSSSDPTFVPGARGGRGRGRGAARGKTVSRQTSKKAPSSKAAPLPASESEPTKVIHNEPASAAAPAQDDSPPVETTQQVSPVSSTDTSPLSTTHKSSAVPPTLHPNTHLSYLLSKFPLHQAHKPVDKPARTSATQVKPAPVTHSTPNPMRRPPIPGGCFPKPQLRTEESDGLPPKAAEMYDAFGAKSSSIPPKLLQPVTSIQKSLTDTTVVSAKSLPAKSSSKKHQSSKVPAGLSHTEALRYKLLKKLKAKKRRLAELNEKLGQEKGASGLQPDSTDLGSPNTVTSSTYDSSICDDILSDLLSPATTASNLSPDSTGFLEMLANGQDGVDVALQVNPRANEPNTENFLDDFDFLSQAVAQRQTEMETEALSALEFFV